MLSRPLMGCILQKREQKVHKISYVTLYTSLYMLTRIALQVKTFARPFDILTIYLPFVALCFI